MWSRVAVQLLRHIGHPAVTSLLTLARSRCALVQLQVCTPMRKTLSRQKGCILSTPQKRLNKRVGWLAGNTSACVWKISNFSYDQNICCTECLMSLDVTTNIIPLILAIVSSNFTQSFKHKMSLSHLFYIK